MTYPDELHQLAKDLNVPIEDLPLDGGHYTAWTPESGQKQCLPIPYPSEDDE